MSRRSNSERICFSLFSTQFMLDVRVAYPTTRSIATSPPEATITKNNCRSYFRHSADDS